jgi:hypothetical protein
MSSEGLISDDAADLAKTFAEQLDLKLDDIDAWADRRRHTVERDPPGWNIERRGHPYAKITIDSDGHGFWWVGVMYAK